jgi:hypothetical protein
MLHLIWREARTSRNVLLMGLLFLFFFGLYVFLDFEGNTNYQVMTDQFGAGITAVHIGVNVIIATLTAIMVAFSIFNYRLTRQEPVGSNAIPVVTFLFGLLTFGCTSCVVAFLGAIGIAFTPLVLPNGNLLWKFAALAIVLLGFVWILYTIHNSKCKIKQ